MENLTLNSNSQEILAQIEQTLNREIQQRHSFFQLKYFLIGKEPTNQAKMWQCLRELKTRKDTLDSITLELEECNDNIALIDISIKKLNLDIEKLPESDYKSLLHEEILLKAKKLNRKKKSAINKIKEIEEKKKCIEQECIFFVETFKQINSTEVLKNFDDLDAQKEYWENKLSKLVSLKLLGPNNLDTDVVDTIISLPDDINIKGKLINMMSYKKDSIEQSNIQESQKDNNDK